VQEKAAALGTRLEYARVDVRDVDVLKQVVDGIAEKEGGIDGLIAAAGIQQETPAIDYAAEDAK
jgi:NAD(P)-dependent dehydrogenase (short-subunit alcohol dehydrogenase family)